MVWRRGESKFGAHQVQLRLPNPAEERRRLPRRRADPHTPCSGRGSSCSRRSSEVLRRWVRRIEGDSRWREGLTTHEGERSRAAERETRKLKCANGSLRKASAGPTLRSRSYPPDTSDRRRRTPTSKLHRSRLGLLGRPRSSPACDRSSYFPRSVPDLVRIPAERAGS
jgi:hypothetical protein